MFSISKNEFTDLPAFVEKVRALKPVDTDGSGSGSGSGDGVHDLLAWCAERGFILHFSKTPSGVFYTLKYDRAKLTKEQYATVGRFRSVVFDDTGRICCVAPPKMLNLTDEMNTLPVNSAGGYLHAEEIVEGIMANLFWHSGWYIATKSCVGEVSYDHIIDALAQSQLQEPEAEAAAVEPATATFQKLSVPEVLRRRICDVLSLLPGGLESLPKQYCYSLVIQHPKNQIVNVITVPKLYLVAVYELSNAGNADSETTAIRIDRDIFSPNFGGSVSHMPSGLSCIATTSGAEGEEDTTATATFTPHTVEDYCRMYASADTRSVSLPGVVFVDKDTGFCYKKRNPKYESVKKRKGMEQKLMAQYLQLRKNKDHMIDEYLKYHPQHSGSFRQFRDRLHQYTQRLYDAYVAHYVKKEIKPLKEYDRELKTHMYKLHYDVYLATMKETGAFVTKHTVINYVNQLAVAQQLACLNTGVVGAVGGAAAKLPIQRSSRFNENSESRSGGFRNPRPTRGGRSAPSLTVQIPSEETTPAGGRDLFASQQLKGAKSTGSVKVHNRFAGLDVD